MKIIFLPGLGQDASSYQKVQAELAQYHTETLSYRQTENFSQLRQEVLERLRFESQSFVLVGLSLGGLLALSLVQELPLCCGLVLSGSQYKLKDHFLFRLQISIMSLLPKSFYRKKGLDKNRILSLQKSMINLDLTSEAKAITSPTLIICGSKDKANLKAARNLSHLIDRAELTHLAGGKHELNRQNPKQFARLIRRYLKSHFP